MSTGPDCWEKFMRKLFATVALLGLLSVASAQDAQSSAPVKQVEPLSEVVVLSCGKFLGAVVVLPDGTLEPITDIEAAKAVFRALPGGHKGVVNTGNDCAPKQIT
jgi:hypothetical protein